LEAGYLLVANNVAEAALGQFNSWYQEEHLPERLGVTGFRKAWRYQALQGNPRYIALYETDSAQVLESAEYLARLANPSQRTRAIMPHFRDMSRTVMRCSYHRAPGQGGLLAVLFLESAAHADNAAAMAEDIERTLAGDPAMEGLTLLRAVNPGAVISTVEAKLRGAADHAAQLVALVQWTREDCGILPDLTRIASAHGFRHDGGRGGVYRLLCMREAAPRA
jgi:hypothetical protein